MQAINLPERFWRKVDRSGGSEACWPWLAASVGGYPIFVNPIDRLVRRYLWFLLHGEKPTGSIVSCRFDNVACVNPDHLVKRSISERTEHAIAKGTFRSPFINCTEQDRSKYAAAAKEIVDALGARHLFTSEQRGKGHAKRGCTPGGTTRSRRASFEMSTADRRTLLQDPCVYCNSVATEADHIQPYARGGSHDAMNRAPACLPCNRVKNDKSLLQFLVARVTA